MTRFSMLLCVIALSLTGCVEQKKSSTYEVDHVDLANTAAQKICFGREWVVTEKTPGADTIGEGLKLKLRDLKGDDRIELLVYDTHKFYAEFKTLCVGQQASFLNIGSLDQHKGKLRKQSSHLAPRTKVTEAYARDISGY